MQIFNQPITKIINERYSVRNYSDQPIAEKELKLLDLYIQQINEEFAGKIRIALIEQKTDGSGKKLGTYGMIKGAGNYLACVCTKGEYYYETLGYAFEKVVLYCTSLGLGTVWLGGTFNKGQFGEVMKPNDQETLPIVSPVGYEGGRKSLFASLIKSNHKVRKPFEANFYDGTPKTPLTKETAGLYYDAFEAVRLAPSARNMQPWKLIKDGENVHFYQTGPLQMNRIDLGIALCHFHLTLQEQNMEGAFHVKDPGIKIQGDYVVSWIK